MIVGATSSEHALLVILELHDEGLDILALALPVIDALLGVAVEVLLLLIVESLSLESISLLLLELLDGNPVLDVRLLPLEVEELLSALLLFLLLLLLSHLQLFVANLPELGEVLLLLLFGGLLSLFPVDLQLARPLNSGLHLSLALLLLFIESVGAVFSFSNLPVEDFLLVILQRSELLNLRVDHALPRLLFVLEALILALLLHVLKLLTLLSKLLDLLFLFDLLQTLGLLHPHELIVGLSEVSAHLGDLLLAHDLALLLTLQVLVDLPLDELALEHLLLERLDEVELEVFELLADVFSVRLLELVLLLELCAHLFIVLVHLLTLDLFPVSVDITIDCLFALCHSLLGFLLVGNIAHHHLSLKGLDHVLVLGHRLVGPLDLLAAQLILVVLLLGIETSALKLSSNSKINGYTIMKVEVVDVAVVALE